jgi:hypothetical protein
MSFNIKSMMKWCLFAVLATMGTHGFAAVVTPHLGILTIDGDTGISNTSGDLEIDATALAILSGTDVVGIEKTPVSLTATYSSSSGADHVFVNGMLNIGNLLVAEFDNMVFSSLGNGQGVFSADLIYTGGDLAGSLSGGRIEGAFVGASADDFSLDFTADTAAAIVGAVVPVPVAAWLFGSGIMMLFGFAHKNRNRGETVCS